MGPFAVDGVRLAGIVASVPARVASNETLAWLTPEQRQRFIDTVGIRMRRVAPAGTTSGDLCTAAARRLLDTLELPAGSIGALVFVTQTPDQPLPGNAMRAQHALGLATSAWLLDLHQGCAGYVYGLATLASMMASTGVEHGLLLAGDTLTHLLAPEDPGTVPLFSDAGSATLLSRAPGTHGLAFNLGADGAGADVIDVPAGGVAPARLRMRGVDVVDHSLRRVPPNVAELLAFCGATTDTPDHYVLHQANGILNRLLLKRLGVAPARAPQTLLDYGNTSVATIPVTLCARLGEALREQAPTLLLAGFGAGFAFASALLRVQPPVPTQLIELADDHA